MKNLVSKKIILAFGILLIAIIAVIFFVLSQNKEEPVLPPVSQPLLTEEPFSLSNCAYADLIQTDSELNINLSKTNIFGGIYAFLRSFPEQKETRILGMKLNKEGEVLNLKDLCSELDISIPDEIAKKISDRYTLIGFFSQLKNKEWELKNLGLILETKPGENEAVKESLKKWEGTMAGDVISLALVKNKKNLPLEKLKGIEFRDGDYKNTAIRYCPLPFSLKKSKAINYVFTDDKIFITTSKESIYAVIDLLE